ncbi:MAG: flavodoxin domain-containing protein [Promethearchaeota archaeon]
MHKILIAYGTRRGVTAETASIIADILREKFSHTVDIIDLKKQKGEIELGKYQNVIIGSSIAYDRWTKEAKKFLLNDFTDKRVAVFVCSGNAGGAAEKNEVEEYQDFQKKYIDNVLSEYTHIKPVATKAFGGRVRYFRITFFDNWNRDIIVSWAEELGEKLK